MFCNVVASMEYNNFFLQSSNCISGVAAFVAAVAVVAVELTRDQPSEPCRDVQCMLFYICHKIINIMTFATMYTWWNLTEEACWNHMQDCRGALKLKSDSGQRQPKKKKKQWKIRRKKIQSNHATYVGWSSSFQNCTPFSLSSHNSWIKMKN